MKRYIVQTFKGSKSEVSEFNDLEFAKKHVKSNPCSLVFRREQVSRIEGGYVSLFSHDSQPMELEGE